MTAAAYADESLSVSAIVALRNDYAEILADMKAIAYRMQHAGLALPGDTEDIARTMLAAGVDGGIRDLVE